MLPAPAAAVARLEYNFIKQYVTFFIPVLRIGIIFAPMEFTPFTLDEAAEICEDFEDLKDSEFTLFPATTYLVEDVVICPFNEADKAVFIANYISDRDGGRALVFYNGDQYDVILFVFDVNDGTALIHMGIRSYAIEKGVRYDFPVHD